MLTYHIPRRSTVKSMKNWVVLPITVVNIGKQSNTYQQYAMNMQVLFVVQGVNKGYQMINKKINKNKINTVYFFLIPLRNLRLLLHSVLHCLLSMMCLLGTVLTEKLFSSLPLIFQTVCFLWDSCVVVEKAASTRSESNVHFLLRNGTCKGELTPYTCQLSIGYAFWSEYPAYDSPSFIKSAAQYSQCLTL